MPRYAQRTEPRTPTNAPNNLADREIIAREPATWPHPKTRHQIKATNVTCLLLAPRHNHPENDPNGDEAYECNQCGHVRETVHGIMSHLKAHLDRPSEPAYPMETVRHIVRLVKQAERDGYGKQTMKYVAKQLNEQNVPTRDGEPWNHARVYGVHRRWHDKIRVRVSNRHPVVDPVEVPIVENVEDRTIVDEARDLVKSLRQASHVATALTVSLQDIESLIDRMEKVIADDHRPDPKIIEKARRWDQMHQLLSQ